MSSSAAEAIPHSMEEDAGPPRPKLPLYPLKRGHLLQKRGEGRRREYRPTGPKRGGHPTPPPPSTPDNHS